MTHANVSLEHRDKSTRDVNRIFVLKTEWGVLLFAYTELIFRSPPSCLLAVSLMRLSSSETTNR